MEIKKIITHKNCPDGQASAYILYQVFNDAEFLFVNHNTKEYNNIAAEPGLLFCDISPPKERVKEFLQVKSIVLDHHATAKPIVDLFVEAGLGKFGDEKKNPGISGAMLAYMFIKQNGLADIFTAGDLSFEDIDNLKNIARLIGIRDTWQRTSPDWEEACSISSAMLFFPFENITKEFPEQLFKKLSTIGNILYNNKITKAKEELKNSILYINNKGLKARIISGNSLSSDVSDLDNEADIIVSFQYKVIDQIPNMILSLRSRSNFNVDKLAISLGGGGHTKAAGATLILEDNSLQPYTVIKNILEKFENE